MLPPHQFSLRRLFVLSAVTGAVVGTPLLWIGGLTGLLYALAMFAMLGVISPTFLSFFLPSKSRDGSEKPNR